MSIFIDEVLLSYRRIHRKHVAGEDLVDFLEQVSYRFVHNVDRLR
jgi:hypothetical protein